MKKIIILFILLFALASCSPEENTIVVDNDLKIKTLSADKLSSSYVSWYGRHEYKDNQMYFYNTATGFKIEFIGSAISIDLLLTDKNNDIYFSTAKDEASLLDGDIFVLSEEEQTLLVTYDTYELHQFELVKRSEPEDGITSVMTFETNGEFQEVTIDEMQTHFLLIGASGISGHGALGNAGEARTTENSSSLHSFGYLTANQFDGSFEFVSNSGWGLAFGYNDTTGKNNIVKAYESVGIDADEQIVSTTYDHEVVPDVIIVNIGGNDYSAVINKLTGFSKEEKIQEFKTAVQTFILKLRADAPNAHIFWTMTEGSLNGAAAVSAISLLSASDQNYVHVVVILGVGDENTAVGADNHCSYETHLLSSEILVNEIESYTDLIAKE
ncbi:MAG: hypothetical protein WCR19_00615 [Acholeplasmataceae bacterium]